MESVASAHRTPATARTTKSNPAIRFMLYLRVKSFECFPRGETVCLLIVTGLLQRVDCCLNRRVASTAKARLMSGLGPRESARIKKAVRGGGLPFFRSKRGPERDCLAWTTAG